MRTSLFGLILLAAAFVGGCSSSKNTSTNALVGEEKVVDMSRQDKPAWLAATSDIVEGDMFVTGVTTKAYDMSFGMNQAQADAMQKLMNTMSNNVKTWTTQALQGANLSDGDIGRMSKFAVGWVSDTRRISGVTYPENYWEKVQKNEGTKISYTYNCYTRLKLAKKDYDAAVSGAYEEMKRQAQKEQNEKAEKVADELLQDLKAGK